MDMTAETTDAEIRSFVGTDGFERIDEFEIAERAWRLANDRGYVTASGVTLTDADEIEHYLIDLARERVQDEIDSAVRGLIIARNEAFGKLAV